MKCDGKIISSKNGYDIIECDSCMYKHILPIPSDDDLEKIYSDEYYTEIKPEYIKKVEEDLKWWNINYDERYNVFESELGKKGDVLDIGSGTGHFLKRGNEKGWNTLGFEPSKAAFTYSTKKLKLKVLNQFFTSESKNQVGLFDAIHMSEVLEHIPSPKILLKNAYDNLNKNGLICISVPNDYNPIQLILKNYHSYQTWWEDPPHHINYFNMSSLESLLLNTGFKIVKKTVTFPIDLFLLMGKNYIGNDMLGRECHSLRKDFETHLSKSNEIDFKDKLYQKFLEVGIGREIIIYGKKE